MVTPVGLDVESSWEALLAGTPGGGPIAHFDTQGYATRIACEIKDFDPLAHLSRKEARRYDRFAQFAVAAAGEAMRQAGLAGPPAGCSPTAFGVVIGSGVGGIATLEANCRILDQRGPGRVSPFFIPMFIPDIAAGIVSIRYGLRGPNYATVSACASGAHAIGEAARHIERGEADLMLAGGAEAAVTPITIAGFSAMKAMSRRNDDPAGASRPFDAGRDGFVIGEGRGHPAARGDGTRARPRDRDPGGVGRLRNYGRCPPHHRPTPGSGGRPGSHACGARRCGSRAR